MGSSTMGGTPVQGGSRPHADRWGRRMLEAARSVRPPRLSVAQRVTVGVVAALVPFGVQYVLLPEPSIAPFVFFFGSVAVAAWLGGLFTGLLAVALSAVLGNYFFIPPYREWAFTTPAMTATALFVVSASIVALQCASYRQAILRAQQSADLLRRQAELLRLSHDAVIVSPFEGGVESWSRGAESLYGFSVAEAVGKSATDLLRTVLPQPRSEILGALRRQGFWEGVLVQTTKGGQEVTVSAKLQLVRGDDSVERMLESHRDITERVRAEEVLREADKRKSAFLATLSHELRNPLAPIHNSLFILNHAAAGSEQVERAKEVLERQVGQLSRLVDDLLDLTRISRGKMRIVAAPIELRDVLRRAVEDRRALILGAGLELDVCLGDAPLWVNGDVARLAQAVDNLLSNAVKFTPAGGHVRIALEEDRPRHTAVIRVCDDGSGIERVQLQRLFQPFEQAESTLERSKGGLGLGLALVKGVVELHGGQVEAHSGGPHQGAEFVIRLPVVEVAPPISEAAAVSLASPRRRVLVIDDNVDAAETLRAALEMDRHEVIVAYDGREGLARARVAGAPDVVLCDVGLAGMDGYEVARAFRADPALRTSFLVAVTGYALPEDVARARAAGFDLHLAKPASVSRLRELFAALPYAGVPVEARAAAEGSHAA